MAQPVILAFGGTATWIRKPFEALAEHARVVAVTPKDPMVWLRTRGNKNQAHRVPVGNFKTSSLLAPFGWASWSASAFQPALWRRALASNDLTERDVQAVFVASPHYFPLVRDVVERVPVYYYAVDSYRDYPGWNALAMAKAERDIVRTASRSFFVSEAMAMRAVEEYGVTPGKTAVSMNATSEEFLDAGRDSPSYDAVAAQLAQLPRPIVVIIGAVSYRLNFGLLTKCADSDHVGTLLFVGPDVGIAMEPDEALRLAALKRHPKCRFVGARPHAELPLWNFLSDIALVPYRRSDLNRFCSPMRLFDHLASGRPVVATDACHQVRRFEELVGIGSTDEEVLQRLADACASTPAGESSAREIVRNGHLWRHRAQAIHEAISRTPS
jgi:glycosyltransferase involved in cell wall biosynthesis